MWNFTPKYLALAITAGIAGLNTGSVVAQASDSRTDSRRNAPNELEEIVVTVERREQSLQDYAGVAQAFNQESLDQLGVAANIQNLQNIVPGLNIANQEGNIEMYIRGVGSSNNTELGDPGAATHINGVYIPRPRGVGSMFYDVERVEINKGPQGTLRGRNATAGSLNIVTKKPTFDEMGGDFEFVAGKYDTRGYRGAINIPVLDNLAFRFAGSSQEHDSYFDNASPGSNLEAAGTEDTQSGRLSMLWDITEQTTLHMVADLTKEGGTGYPGAQIKNALQAGVGFDDLDDPRKVLYRGAEGDLDSEHKGIMGSLIHEFSGVSLELSASYRDLDFKQSNASNDGVFFEGHNAVNQDDFSTQFWDTQSESSVYEARLFSNGDGPFSWTAGAFYFEEDQEAALFSTNDHGTWYSGTEWVMPDVQSESWAVYMDGSYAITDRWTVYGGARYTEEEKSRFGSGGNWAFAFFTPGDEWGTAIPSRIGTAGFKYDGLGRSNYDIANATREEMYAYLLDSVTSWGENDNLDDQLNCLLDTACTDVVMPWGDGALPVQQKGTYKDDFSDFRIGSSYQISDGSMVYATISTGHKSGGFNDTIIEPDGSLVARPYSPEELVMYEVGSKNEFEWAGIPTRLNASAFFYDYSDQVFQMIVAVGEDDSASSLQNVNVANSEIFGLELEGKFILPYSLTLDTTMLWLQTEIKDGVLADTRQGWGADLPVVDLSGNELALAPEFTLNVALSQAIETSWGYIDWIVSAQYKGDYYLSIWNNTDYDLVGGQTVVGSDPDYADEVDAYVNVDATVGLSYEDTYRVELYGTNLTDEVYSNKAIIDHGNNLRFTNLPRTYGVRLKMNF